MISVRKNKLSSSCCKKICFKLQKISLKFTSSKVVKGIKIITVLASNTMLSYSPPNIQLSEGLKVLESFTYILCFIFFLIETLANIRAYGLYKGSKSYLKRDYFNIILLIILFIEFLWFTPLSNSDIFIGIFKIKLLRLFSILQLRYEHDWGMKILIKSMRQLIPKIFKLLVSTLVIYFFFALILTKVYKGDGYYCDNSYDIDKIKTKEDCFNWGGDWVQYKLNFSNVFHSLLAIFLVNSMESWMGFMKQLMNFNG